jgi:hypothetical protein
MPALTCSEYVNHQIHRVNNVRPMSLYPVKLDYSQKPRRQQVSSIRIRDSSALKSQIFKAVFLALTFGSYIFCSVFA